MNPFDCATCEHSIIRHTETRWPQIANGCRDCPCTGYTPNYRGGTDGVSA